MIVGNVSLDYIHGVPCSGHGKTFRWEVREEFSVTLRDGSEYKVEKGFRCDLESAPSILWYWYPPFHDGIRGTIVHDHMYINRYMMKEMGRYEAQKFADNEYYHLLMHYNPNEPKKNLYRFRAVRLFGHKLYTDDGRT